MTMAGYLLGNVPFVAEHFEKVVLLILLVSVLPILIGGFRHWSANRSRAGELPPRPDEPSEPHKKAPLV
jgi:membrane-associated protein